MLQLCWSLWGVPACQWAWDPGVAGGWDPGPCPWSQLHLLHASCLGWPCSLWAALPGSRAFKPGLSPPILVWALVCHPHPS